MRFLIAAYTMVCLIVISMGLTLYLCWPITPTTYPDIALDLTYIPPPPELIPMKYSRKTLTKNYYRKLNNAKR